MAGAGSSLGRPLANSGRLNPGFGLTQSTGQPSGAGRPRRQINQKSLATLHSSLIQLSNARMAVLRLRDASRVSQ